MLLLGQVGTGSFHFAPRSGPIKHIKWSVGALFTEMIALKFKAVRGKRALDYYWQGMNPSVYTPWPPL